MNRSWLMLNSSSLIVSSRVSAGPRAADATRFEERDQCPVDHRTDDRGPGPARPTEDQDGPDRERDHGVEGVRLDRALLDHLQHAGHTADDTAEHQGLQLVPVGVLAERPGRIFVFTDRLERPTPGGPHQPVDQQDDHDQQTQPTVRPRGRDRGRRTDRGRSADPVERIQSDRRTGRRTRRCLRTARDSLIRRHRTNNRIVSDAAMVMIAR